MNYGKVLCRGLRKSKITSVLNFIPFLFTISCIFKNFSPGATFEKWAAKEVADFKTIPEGMETITLKDGLYAVFLYKGAASAASGTFQYIFGTWLPGSAYVLDDRPHFEVMGAKYKNEDPESEEELWIPIRPKK